MCHSQVREVMAEVDTDRSGSIDKREVVAWAKRGSVNGKLVEKLVGGLGARIAAI